MRATTGKCAPARCPVKAVLGVSWNATPRKRPDPFGARCQDRLVVPEASGADYLGQVTIRGPVAVSGWMPREPCLPANVLLDVIHAQLGLRAGRPKHEDASRGFGCSTHLIQGVLILPN
jgi:hypothetical protein